MSVLRHRFVYSALFIVLAASAGRTQTAPTPFRGVPIRLPGTIEVEDFDDGGEGIAYHDLTPSNEGGAYRATDVDLQPTSDAGGGYNLGWVNAGEWLTYTVSVATTGLYTVEFRLASLGPGGNFHLEVNGTDVTGPLNVGDSRGWQNWFTATPYLVIPLSAGIQHLKLVMDSEGRYSVGNFNWMRFALAPSTPFTGTSILLPGRIEAEDFDNGGPGAAYVDDSPGNSGGGYRATDVDIEAASGGGFDVGWVTPGEWLKYTVNVAAAGSYVVSFRVASLGPGGTFHLEVNGTDVTGAIRVPDTGDWQTWQAVTKTVTLSAGVQVARLVMDTAGMYAVGNFDSMTFTSTVATPYTGMPIALPGRVEAEDFDNGGPGIAYVDDSPGNSGGAYRATDVDLEPTTDTAGGYNVGWVSAGEWLSYTANVATAGVYTVQVRVASPGAGGSFHLEANGVDLTGPMAIPDTGAWQVWTTIERAGIPLAAGTQTWRLVMDTPGASGAVGNFNWVQVVASDQTRLRIISPAPGSSLLATSVTFMWAGEAGEFHLTIGRTPGAADIYASGPLSPTTKAHTVSGLPLNGQTLYVEVHGQTGDVIDTASVQYTAAVRRGLAIITDFDNRRLEDWTGAGVKSLDDLSAQLRKMEQHWAWLSRGLETMRWDIIRVQLPVPEVADAYPNWMAFRDAVITLAREQVRTADYDVNVDGVIDAAWLVVSLGNDQLPFVMGGASRNAGANLFVDGQASDSINAGAIGNFNHELGHCLGLPDMYGTYSTMSTLTDMAYSWPVPPPDFSAYERLKLGWLTPQVVTETTRGILLPSANDTLAAVKVPTNKPAEYFLIEYRRRPASGFGSSDANFNGLAVYHVLEGSSMSQDPPILKLEPADGNILPGQSTDPNDFYSPENPSMIQPGVFFSYIGDGSEVFRLDNLAWRNGGISFDIAIAGPQPSSNLLANGSFETGQAGVPQAWQPGAWIAMPGAFKWPAPIALTDGSSAQLDVPTENDARWAQPVTTLVTGQSYMLCGWLKGDGIAGSGTVGANVSVMGGFVRSEGLFGTFDWTQRCVTFTADAPRVEVACRLGFYSSLNSGRLWCDDFTLELVRKPF